PSVPSTTKGELSVHLEGAVRPARLLSILRRHDLHSHLRSTDDVAFLFAPSTFTQFLDHFRFVVTSLRDVDDVHGLALDLFAELRAQNVVYAEVIFSAAVFVRKGMPLSELMAAVTEAADATSAVTARYNFVLDLVRTFGADAARDMAREIVRLQHPRVVGIHLGGDEERFPARDFAGAYAIAAEAGLGRAAHAGEASGPASIWDAIDV